MDAADFFDDDNEQQLGLSGDADLAEGYRPSEDESYMNPRQIEYFRRKLLDWREKLLKESGESLGSLREEIVKEVDFLDQGSLEANTSLKLKTRERCQEVIREIDEALERIEDGTYGYCEETGEEIGIKRLEARPTATLSLEAQEWRERGRKRNERGNFADTS
jgi:DnaK suppressor protein